ncbi:MAG: M20/M25/M40 family metallo-hydrolase [Chloroflexi bacterium]|nr:M20/M25/M40 family metallo-hydrolase [Chloroflexota bacterium]
MRPQTERYVRDHLADALALVKRLCAQPSVSAQNYGVQECASLVGEVLTEAGFQARLLPTADPRYPVVYAELSGESPHTLLLYNHYDVQPPDPLELWESPPFQPVEREGRLYGRGVYDDKGEIGARLAAVRALLETRGRLPCTVKFLIEGAEEIGSPGLEAFVKEHRELLRADACIWEGGGVNWEGQPQITLGVKGMAYVELECRAAATDSHSSYAPVVPNAAWRLAWALSTLKGPDERVRIRGFYDDVVPPTEAELEAIRAMPAEEALYKESLGVRRFLLDAQGFEFRRRVLLEPTCNICGIQSGYTGEGTKTVLPAVARAKLDFRLVPEQRPEDIVAKLRVHLEEHGFQDVEVMALEGEAPARTPMDSPWVALVTNAARTVYGKEPVIIPTMPGTGPMHPFVKVLGLPVASSGIGYPDNRIHAPNENIRHDYFLLGVLHAVEIMERLGQG